MKKTIETLEKNFPTFKPVCKRIDEVFKSFKTELSTLLLTNSRELNIKTDGFHIIGDFTFFSGQKYYFDTNDIRFWKVCSMRITKDERLQRAYNQDGGENKNVIFIDYDENFIKNFIEKVINHE